MYSQIVAGKVIIEVKRRKYLIINIISGTLTIVKTR